MPNSFERPVRPWVHIIESPSEWELVCHGWPRTNCFNQCYPAEEEVSGMRGYPRYIVRIMEITRIRERGEMSSKINIDTIARFPYCGAFSTTILV